MAIRHSINLSTTEPNNEVGILKIRQADEETQTLVVQITENSTPKSYEGLQPFFCAKLGQSLGLGIIEQKLNVEELTNPKNGQLEYTMRPEDWQHLGQQTGYFSFRKMKDNHSFVEQFSTRDFNFIITKNIYSNGIKEIKKDGSTYVWTFEDLLRLFNEYIASGKSDWEEFVEQNREIIESVDPGGKLLGELIDAKKPINRNTFPRLGDRLNYYDKLFNRIAYFIEEFEVDGQTDWTQAFANAINFISSNGGGSLVLGQGNVYEGQFILNKPNIKIFGGGTIKGTLLLDMELVDNTQPVLNARIEGIKFAYDGVNDYCIELYRARDVVITDCYFSDDILHGIIFKQTPTYNQMSARIMIENNDFNGGYALFCEHDTNFFPLADIHWNNNMCKNKITNIHVFGVDGMSFSGNTMFLPGTAKKDTNKEYNIYIKRGIWITIDSSNHLFESGLESILLDKCQNPVISGVSIAWPGQRIPSDAIKIKNGDTEGQRFVMGSITGCNIVFPTRHGISVEGNCGGIAITGNKIKSAGYAGYYYGETDLSIIDHFGINAEATTSDLLITNNNTRDNINNILGQTNYYADNFDINQNLAKKNRVLTLSTTDTVISVKGRDTINLNQPSSTSIESFIEGFDGQEITLVGFNGNTKIKTSAAYLIGRLDVQMTVGSIIRLRYSSGNWYEVGSNINRNRVTSGPTNSRPTTGMQIADLHYDTSLNKPTWWSGLAWKDANGTTI